MGLRNTQTLYQDSSPRATWSTFSSLPENRSLSSSRIRKQDAAVDVVSSRKGPTSQGVGQSSSWSLRLFVRANFYDACDSDYTNLGGSWVESPIWSDSWKQSVRSIRKHYNDRVKDSRLEERHCFLVIHYEKADDVESAAVQAGECANHIDDVGLFIHPAESWCGNEIFGDLH
ncbi:hypothetical protein K490DRAFT_68837 [Saccharata proteae CBS 121410]|uniref:Uncharacterized protein n=1 Tax=Saccharata proteae CBS 121410 TaxID=1314787 RepID=A0A9P4HMI9_9PEZI|nr:hypothetical protein K490DRAFT_68837 [Saccharata proteae CBS 121410]